MSTKQSGRLSPPACPALRCLLLRVEHERFPVLAHYPFLGLVMDVAHYNDRAVATVIGRRLLAGRHSSPLLLGRFPSRGPLHREGPSIRLNVHTVSVLPGLLFDRCPESLTRRVSLGDLLEGLPQFAAGGRPLFFRPPNTQQSYPKRARNCTPLQTAYTLVGYALRALLPFLSLNLCLGYRDKSSCELLHALKSRGLRGSLHRSLGGLSHLLPRFFPRRRCGLLMALRALVTSHAQ